MSAILCLFWHRRRRQAGQTRRGEDRKNIYGPWPDSSYDLGDNSPPKRTWRRADPDLPVLVLKQSEGRVRQASVTPATPSATC